LSTYAPDGVSVIKKALKKAEEVGKESISIKYLGAGAYSVSVQAKNYKEAEKILKEATEKSIEFVKLNEGSGEFQRVGA
jgi:translation initiation factor 2 subunit 1